MISILVPTRGRKDQFHRMLKSAYETAGCEIEILIAYQTEEDAKEYGYDGILVSDTNPTAHSWNMLADRCSGDIMMLGSDDMIFDTQDWGKRLEEHYHSLSNKIHVWHLQDSRDKDGTPHPIVSREYYNAMGYFVPPIFLHWYIDTWTVSMAKACGVFTHIRDSLLVHDKPSDRGVTDDTHNRIRRNGWNMRDKYVNEKCQNMLKAETERLRAAVKGNAVNVVSSSELDKTFNDKLIVEANR